MLKRYKTKLALWFLPFLFSSVLMADETEIYFAGNMDEVNANVLFVIDASGSMQKLVAGDAAGRSRLQVLKDTFSAAMTTAPSNVNIGLMGYANQPIDGFYWWRSINGVSFPPTAADANVQPLLAPYQNSDNLPNPTAGNQTVRSFLSQVVNSWQASGYTPIVDSLYEAARYYRGEDVGWGRAPSGDPWAAHPLTYMGNINCTDLQTEACTQPACNETTDMASCTTVPGHDCCNKVIPTDGSPEYCENENWTCGSAVTTCQHSVCKAWTSAENRYISPIKNACQSNFIVLMSDGKPEYPYYSNMEADGTKYLPPSVTNPINDPASTRPNIPLSASTNTSQVKVSKKLPDYMGRTCAVPATGYLSGMCGSELTHWLAETDNHPTLPQKQTVDTYAIGFAMDAEPVGKQYLESLVTKDNGFYDASNAAELYQAFSDIMLKVKKASRSFSSPTYSVDQNSLLSHSDEVYMPMFDRSTSQLWVGNLKKFKRKEITIGGVKQTHIIDATGESAVNDKGELSPNAKDFWGTEASGADVQKGGAASRLPLPDNRKLFTDLAYSSTNQASLTSQNNKLDALNTSITGDLLGNAALSDAERTRLLDFIRGKNADSTPRYHIGDTLNSKPLVASYVAGDGTATTNHSYVFMATNEGYIHALDADTGVEQWAFMPKSLLKNIAPQLANMDSQEHIYGIDGTLTLWEYDANKDGKIRAGSGADDDKLYLYFGLRRGGAEYYALDISNINEPKVAWHIARSTSQFAKLGQAWSKPENVKMRVADATDPRKGVLKDVLVFGAGYDPAKDNQDVNTRTPDTYGTDIYIVDALTGEKIWSLSQTSAGTALEHSVPSDIRVMDMDRNGALDRLYFADTGGNVWRVDMDTDVSDADSTTFYDYSKATLTKFAELGGTGSNKRMFFYEPDVALFKKNGKDMLTVSIGSGYRAHPLDAAIDDRFYVLLDRNPYDRPSAEIFPIKEDGNLSSIDDTTYFDSSASNKNLLDQTSLKGWYLTLPNTDEKVLAPAVTFMNKVVFTTFAPVDEFGIMGNTDYCRPMSTARAYILDLFNGSAVADLDRKGTKDRSVVAGVNEILDSAQVVFRPPAASNGEACTTNDCKQWVELRVGKVDLPLMDESNSSTSTTPSETTEIGNLIQRLYWLDRDVTANE